jgi:hypothetical protein
MPPQRLVPSEEMPNGVAVCTSAAESDISASEKEGRNTSFLLWAHSWHGGPGPKRSVRLWPDVC